MTQSQLYEHLKSLGLPVAYNSFTDYQETPFIVYIESGSSDLIADNYNYKEIKNFDIELYTSWKSIPTEELIQDKLKELQLPYNKSEVWIQSERVFRILYEISIT